MSKIMLIDDDVVMVDLLETLLKMEGFDVITQSIGEDIVQSIQTLKPDVILMDVYLKTSQGNGEDGLILLAQIREIPDLSKTKVILSSGINFRIESKEGGADGFLHKPYMPEELIDMIKQVL